MSQEPATTHLNGLLRAELSATSTYQHLLERGNDDSAELRQLLNEHQEAARLLSAQIAELGGSPSDEPSTWTGISAITAGAALSDPVAIKALKDGEEQDILSYERVVSAPELDEDTRELVRDMLLPRARAHVPVLDELLRRA